MCVGCSRTVVELGGGFYTEGQSERGCGVWLIARWWHWRKTERCFVLAGRVNLSQVHHSMLTPSLHNNYGPDF
jgi:hypothetical protein